MEDPVPMLTRRHFEFGLGNCRKSITQVDLDKYDEFKRKFDPSFVSRGAGVRLRWPDQEESSHQTANKDDDLDLYS